MQAPTNPWSDEERARLRRLRANGYGAVRISQLMGRTKNSVSRQMQALGLGKLPTSHKKGARTARAKPLPPGASTLPPLPSEQR